jgi:enoyl-CoA hydratase/carnithine racemase
MLMQVNRTGRKSMVGSRVELHEAEGIAEIRFRSETALNLLDEEILAGLVDAARALEDREDVKAALIVGGDAHFTAGMNLNAPRAAGRPGSTVLGPRACAAIESIPMPTVAVIDGHCIGGGMAIAAACDFRVVAESARLRVPEIALGMSMGWQSLPRFVALVGPARAKRLVMLAETIDAATAERWGFVDELAPAGQALERARAWARALAAMPAGPVRMTKRHINAVANALNDPVSHMDGDQLAYTLTT